MLLLKRHKKSEEVNKIMKTNLRDKLINAHQMSRKIFVSGFYCTNRNVITVKSE